MNFPKDQSDKKRVFSLETHKEVNFLLTYEALNFTNLPLNPAMQNFYLLFACIL